MAFLSSAELDFETYKQSLKDFLKSQLKFKDYDFEGSNMSVMLDLLARNTYHTGFYVNMVGSEMFLDSAQLRESAVSRAKELNYVPRSRTSAKTTVDIEIFPTDSPSTIVIPKFYTVSSAASTGSVIFSTNEPIAVVNDGGRYLAANVEVYEGHVLSEYFVANTSNSFLIASENVDVNSIEVNVQNSVTDTANSVWSRAHDLYGLNGDSEVFFVQGSGANKYEVVFGNGITGKKLETGNVVRVTYRNTLGEDGNGYTRFKPIRNIDTYSDILVSLTGGPSTGGAERETLESIKFNAPRHFATQQRAVTKEDYVTLVKDAFPVIESITVFGGEELPEKRYGRVAIAAKPIGGEILPVTIKDEIVRFLDDKTSVSIDPIFVDPDYFYIDIDSVIYFDPTLTPASTEELKARVLAAVSQYNNTHLKSFSAPFRLSKLSGVIDDVDVSIQSNETVTRVIKRITPTRGEAQSFVINFGAELDGHHEAAIQSSTFLYDVGGITYSAFLKDNLSGGVDLKTLDALGNEKVLMANVGTVNYTTGRIDIFDFLVNDYTRYIALYAKTKLKDFLIKRNQIIAIDLTDVRINFLTSKN